MRRLSKRRIKQILLSGVLLAATVAVLGVDQRLRGWEAVIAGNVISFGAATDTGVNPWLAIVSFNRETGSPVGLQITPECTSAFLLLPLLAITGLMIWLRRTVTVWPLVALVAATVLLLATNQVRLLAVVILIKGMGFEPGYYWGHTMVGSVISVLGIGVSLVAYAYLAIRRGGRAAA